MNGYFLDVANRLRTGQYNTDIDQAVLQARATLAVAEAIHRLATVLEIPQAKQHLQDGLERLVD